MLIDNGLARLVDEFWDNATKGVDKFPRDMAAVTPLALPLWIERIDRLATNDVQDWLRDHNLGALPLQRNRYLRGCLLAFLGHGAILIDGDDPVDEQRFTLAHEIAHFLLDYRAPRLDAIAQLGADIIAVLDGLRPPTPIEQLHGILRRIFIGVHIDLMERGANGDYGSGFILKSENRADQLAFALLAPAEDAAAQIDRLSLGADYSALRAATTTLVQKRYGLPPIQARAYSTWLLRQMGYAPGFSDWLKIQR